MPFQSKHAPKIWDWLYTVSIPDHVTQNPDYIKKFGIRSSGDKEFDQANRDAFITVKIPIAKILEYYTVGVEIRIPSREDLITIHKNIELYLNEWKEYIQSSVHGQSDVQCHKALILNLEKLSKYIFDRAKPSEIIERLSNRDKFGLINPLQSKLENDDLTKPNYIGIKQLINKTRQTSSNNDPATIGRRFTK